MSSSGPSLRNAVGDASLLISESTNFFGTSGALTKSPLRVESFVFKRDCMENLAVAWEVPK